MRTLSLVAIAFLSFTAQPAAAAPNEVLFRIRPGHAIIGSKYGSLALFQAKMAQAAAGCGVAIAEPAKFADGALGNGTLKLVAPLSTCRAIATAGPGEITEGFWTAIAPDLAPPTAVERAMIMSGANEATDYGDIEFNVGTKDSGVLTWGPRGATANEVLQVQRILKAVDALPGGKIDAAFGSEAGSVRALAATRTAQSATALVTGVKADPTRSAQWKAGFSVLGADAAVRGVYDTLMAGRKMSGLSEAVDNFFRSYWAHCWRPTEVDYGFFYDRAVQITVYQAMADAALGHVQTLQTRAGRPLTPAERRRAVAANFTAGAAVWVYDRLARDVAFYQDGVGQAALTNDSLWALRLVEGPRPSGLKDELSVWRSRTGKLASDYGLSDDRYAPVPLTLAGRAPACVAG